MNANSKYEILDYKPKLSEIFKRYDWWALVFIIILIILSISLWFCSSELAKRFDWISAIIGFIPTIPVLLILYQNKKKSWTLDLPNFLNVNFCLEGQIHSRILYIPLVGLGDIRSQAQTMSRVLGNKPSAQLPLYPTIQKYLNPKVVIDKSNIINSGKPFEMYEVEIELREDYLNEEDFSDVKKKYLSNMTKNQYFELPFPFKKDQIIIKERT